MIRYLKLIIGFVAFLLVFSAGCVRTVSNDNSVHPQNHPTAIGSEIITQAEIVPKPIIVNTPVIINTPVIANITIEMMVPYSKNSIWNNPIGPSPKYDPRSSEMIAALVNEGQFTSDPDQFSLTVYFADENTPHWDIPCLKYKCTVVIDSENTYYKTENLYNVPIPPEAQPSVMDVFFLLPRQMRKAGCRMQSQRAHDSSWTQP